MNNKPLFIVLLVNLVAVLALTFLYPHLMVSPGGLSDAHEELSSDCFACHVVFRGSTPQKCTVCHKVPEIGLRTTKGLAIAGEQKNVTFHQQLIEDDCVACHSEHKGVKAFKPIGRFSHALLQPGVQKACDGCHANPGDALHRKIQGNCAQCHTQDAWKPATFDHDKLFRFDRHHPGECASCHMENDYGRYSCYGCHEHSRSKIREKHVKEGIYNYENCVECHRSGDEHEAEQRWKSGERAGREDNSEYGRDRHKDKREHH